MTREGRTNSSERILPLKSDIQLSNILKSAVVKAGVKVGNRIVRFHCLRKYLIDRLSKYMSDSKWKQIIGKTIDEKAYISLDELANDYARAMVDISWTGIVSESDIEKRVKVEVLKQRARDLGLSDDDIRKAFATMDLEEFEKFLRQKQNGCTNGNCQQMISEAELPNYLSQGWRVQAVLPSGKIVISNEP